MTRLESPVEVAIPPTHPEVQHVCQLRQPCSGDIRNSRTPRWLCRNQCRCVSSRILQHLCMRFVGNASKCREESWRRGERGAPRPGKSIRMIGSCCPERSCSSLFLCLWERSERRRGLQEELDHHDLYHEHFFHDPCRHLCLSLCWNL